MKLLSILLLGVAGLYLLLGLALFFFQRQFIYHPTPVLDHPFESFVFPNEGERISLIQVPGKGAEAILYFGGNAEPAAYSAVDAAKHMSNYPVYLMNYRGYGGSTGTPTEQGLFSDALAVYDMLAAKYGSVYVVGRSLGSGVASYVASQRSVKKLVLITPFDSILNIARKQYPIFPVALMMRDKFESSRWAADIKAKTLVLLAEEDRIIPEVHSQALVDSLSHVSPKLIRYAGYGHNDISSAPDYYLVINAFLK